MWKNCSSYGDEENGLIEDEQCQRIGGDIRQ
jgi:hypothetical protein